MEKTKRGIEGAIEDMQQNLTTSHTTLNVMYKELFKRTMDIEKEYEMYNCRLRDIESVNKMLEVRTN